MRGLVASLNPEVRTIGKARVSGDVSFNVIRQRSELEQPTLIPPKKLTMADIWKFGFPQADVSPYQEVRDEVNTFRTANLRYLLRGLPRLRMAGALGLPHFHGALSLSVIRGKTGMVLPFGLVGVRVVTTAGVNFLVDAWQGTVELEILKYHGIGTGSTAENVTDTALVTELTTEYNPDSTRATGSLTEGASANIFRTVGTNTLDGTPGAALREHGVFSAASAGTLWDRTVFAAITLSTGDGLQSTYDMTASAGG